MTEEEIELLADRVADKVMARLMPLLDELLVTVDEIVGVAESVIDEGVESAWEPASTQSKKEALFD